MMEGHTCMSAPQTEYTQGRVKILNTNMFTEIINEQLKYNKVFEVCSVPEE